MALGAVLSLCLVLGAAEAVESLRPAHSYYLTSQIKALAGEGVKFCLNTDNTGISAIDLKHEYDIAAPAIGLSSKQVHQSQLDALDMAFLSPDEKSDLKRKVTEGRAL